MLAEAATFAIARRDVPDLTCHASTVAAPGR